MRRVAACSLAISFALALGGGLAAGRLSLREAMTATEFSRAGLGKLAAAELEALEEWVAGYCGGTKPRLSTSRSLDASSGGARLVAFNVATKKFHCPSCRHALACTRNCVETSHAEAVARGGVPCQVCGGVCRQE